MIHLTGDRFHVKKYNEVKGGHGFESIFVKNAGIVIIILHAVVARYKLFLYLLGIRDYKNLMLHEVFRCRLKLPLIGSYIC